MRVFKTYSEDETRKVAGRIAKDFTHGVIALTGELGVGKTTFVQGFAKGLGIKEKITSPTFVLIRQHKIPNSKGTFYHVDLYRLEDNQIPKSLGFEDLWINPANIVLIEWAEKTKDLPVGTTNILIEKKDTNQRIITLS